jgi:5-methylcytosine-specific restriction endonuclease McrA
MTTPSLPTPPRPCLTCNTPTTNKGGRCDQHHNQHNEARQFYHSPAWRRVRSWVLTRDLRQCTACGQPGNLVHHIHPRKQGGPDTPDNLVTLCKPCHELIERGHTPTQQAVDTYMRALGYPR